MDLAVCFQEFELHIRPSIASVAVLKRPVPSSVQVLATNKGIVVNQPKEKSKQYETNRTLDRYSIE